jgi:hypothetical protein
MAVFSLVLQRLSVEKVNFSFIKLFSESINFTNILSINIKFKISVCH